MKVSLSTLFKFIYPPNLEVKNIYYIYINIILL